MSKNIREWRIHIGAHKTATTHLQSVMTAIQPVLLERGINYVPHEELRSRLAKAMRKRWWHYSLGEWSRRKFIQNKIIPQPCDAEIAVLSEENILGGALALLSANPYTKVHDRLSFIRSLSNKTSTTLFLSIRSFDRVLPGSYTTGLRNNPTSAHKALQKFLPVLDNNPPSWVDIIERIDAATLGIPLRIWKQEDYRTNAKVILSEFTGTDIDSLPDIARPRGTMTPSVVAVQEVEALLETEQVMLPNWNERVKAIYFSKPATETNPRYTFLTSSQTDRLKMRYEEDLEIISHRWPGMLIHT